MMSGVSRRELLGGLAGLGATALAGCVAGGAGARVSVLSAGSLSVLCNETIGPAFESGTEYSYRGEFHGSKTVMRMVRDGQKYPDVVVSADAGLLRDELGDTAPWDVVFASNALVVTYNPDTAVGKRLGAGEPWYEVLREADARIARSDPDLDPLGYRTVQLFELAEAYYDEAGLVEDLTDNLVVDPQEAHLLAGIETGERAAAVAYRNMAVDHDLPFVSLPPELDFSDPGLADHYASATFTMDDGTTVEGTPVLYNMTVPSVAENRDVGERFVGFVLSRPDLLQEGGLVVPDAFPDTRGPVPQEVLP